MATGDAVGGSSIYRGSEEAFEIECDPCKVDGAITEGNHYCPICMEYLCETCHSHHRKLKATRSHKILSGRNIPKKTSGSNITTPGVLCSCSQNEVDYYCDNHKEVFCSTCRTVKHRSCETKTLDEVIRVVPISKQFKETVDELDQLRKQASETEDLQDDLLDALTGNNSSCMESIQTFRRDINDFLDKLESKTFAELKSLIFTQRTVINDRKSVCSNMKDTLDADHKTSLEVRQRNDAREMFINNLKLSQTVKQYGIAIEDIKNESFLNEITFEKQDILADLKINIQQFGKLRKGSGEVSRQEKKSFLNVTAEHSSQISIGTSVESPLGGIFLENGDLIVTDFSNNRLLLFDSLFQIKDSLEVPGRPWDVTEANNKQIICTLVYVKMLQYVQVYPNMQIKNNIKLANRCYGIKYFDDSIYVTCGEDNKGEVRILTSDGKLRTRIGVNDDGSYIFSEPKYLNLNIEGGKMYVSDYKKGTVTCMKTNGDVIFTYTNPDLKQPRGIITDEEDNFIVCSQRSESIHAVKSDGTFHGKLIEVSNPLWLAYRNNDNTLVVCTGETLITYLLK